METVSLTGHKPVNSALKLCYFQRSFMKSSPKREEAGKRGILPALSMKKSFMLKRCLPCLRVLIYPKNVKNI